MIRQAHMAQLVSIHVFSLSEGVQIKGLVSEPGWPARLGAWPESLLDSLRHGAEFFRLQALTGQSDCISGQSFRHSQVNSPFFFFILQSSAVQCGFAGVVGGDGCCGGYWSAPGGN